MPKGRARGKRCWFGCKMLFFLLLPPHCSIPHLQPAVPSLWFLVGIWSLEQTKGG